MNSKTFLVILSLCTIACSCESEERKAIDKAVNGDILISGKDTFDIIVDTHTVISSERIPARSAIEEGSPAWINRTNLDSTFKTREHRQIGSIQVYKTARKRK